MHKFKTNKKSPKKFNQLSVDFVMTGLCYLTDFDDRLKKKNPETLKGCPLYSLSSVCLCVRGL